MAVVMKKKEAPWWERSKTYGALWSGEFFEKMILKSDDPEEQRIQRLRERALYRPEGKRAYLSIERAKLMTDSYKQTEGEAPILRRAKAYKHVCEHIPIPYEEDQLLMGHFAAVVPGIELEQEFMTSWLKRDVWVEEEGKKMGELDALEVRGKEAIAVRAEDKTVLREYIIPYWQGITHENYIMKQLTENFPDVHFKDNHFMDRASYPIVGGAIAHTIADYLSVLKKGIKALKEEVNAEMVKIDGSDLPCNYEIDRLNTYKAILICADAVVAYARRCAELAEEMAAKESNPERKAELTEMARICYKVPENPAGSWWEAVQSWQIVHTIIHITDGGVSHSAGRFDQYMYPYLQADLDKGGISPKKAQELLECLFIKRRRLYMLPYHGSKRTQSHHTNDKMNLSGMDTSGNDATNRLSFMMLEAHAHVHLEEPIVSFRVHKNTPDDIIKAALSVLRLGSGVPHIINDDAIIPSLVNRGVSLEEAKNYGDIGCQENVTDPNMSGADTNPRSNAGYFNLAKMVEFALYDGVDKLSGTASGVKTGDARNFRSMDEFFAAVEKHIEYAVRMNCVVNNVMDWAWTNWYPAPMFDLLHPGPRQSGIDYENGGTKYNWTGTNAVGLGTATDSLSAIEYMVFDKKIVTMDALLKALDDNWKGHEELRKKCLEAPKWGNDDDYADKWAVRITNALMDEYEKHRTPHGGTFVPGFYSQTTYIFIGSETYATPDGRYARDVLSSAIDPSNFTELRGPTSLHKSASKLDTWRATNGITFNCKFPTSIVAGERGLSKWADLVRTYVLLRGQTVQYNVVNNEALKAAQVKPEEYRDLIVRTGGYSAFFVELDKDTQDSIIARTEHQL